jgi:hypothetical protein
MERTFQLVEQIRNVIEIESWPAAPELTRPDYERLARLRPRWLGEPPTKSLVDDIAERAAGSPSHRFQLRRDIVIQRQCRSHIMMILLRHHDVNHREPAIRHPAVSSHDPSRWIQNTEFM